MSKTRKNKGEMLESYKSILTQSNGYIVVSSDHLSTATLTDLKKELKQNNANFTVVKNTVFKIALQETEQPLQAQEFDGASAIVTYSDDPTIVAKLLKKLQKETEHLEARFGVVEGKFVDQSRVMALADIPSRDELLAKLLGSMNAPLSGFMNAVTGNVRGFVRVVQGVSEKPAA